MQERRASARFCPLSELGACTLGSSFLEQPEQTRQHSLSYQTHRSYQRYDFRPLQAHIIILSSLKYSSLFSEPLSTRTRENIDSQPPVPLPNPAINRIEPFPEFHRLRS